MADDFFINDLHCCLHVTPLLLCSHGIFEHDEHRGYTGGIPRDYTRLDDSTHRCRYNITTIVLLRASLNI